MKRFIAYWALGFAITLVVAISVLAIFFPDLINWIPLYLGHMKTWFVSNNIPSTHTEGMITNRGNLPIYLVGGVLLILVFYFAVRLFYTLCQKRRVLKGTFSDEEASNLQQEDRDAEVFGQSLHAQKIVELDHFHHPSTGTVKEATVPKLSLFGPALAGLLIVALFFVGFLGWAAFAPLSNAAIALGKVRVENNHRIVQHLEGGIVSSISVRDGEKVRAGQILIELDDTKPRARLARLHGQLEADVKQLALLSEEIKTVSDLLERGYANKPRLLALQRRAAELEGDRRRIAAEVEDANDVLKRLKIKAPVEGTIVGLKVQTLGGVIRGGEALLDVVPKNERLIIQAHVSPIDIDVVQKGLKAMVYLTPYNRRSLRPVEGRVITISADLMNNNQTDQSYYIADIELLEDPQKAIKGAILHPGMPVEVMILTGKQTMLQLILQPIWQSVNRSFREN